MTFEPFGLLGKAAGINTPLDRKLGAGAALGGVAGSLLFDKNPNSKAPPGPETWSTYNPQGSTPAIRSGRGSSSLSV